MRPTPGLRPQAPDPRSLFKFQTAMSRFSVIASAAKQSIVRHQERMDCFAALAMTDVGYGHDFASSRHDLPGVLHFVGPRKEKRAQGRPGARCTRGLTCVLHRGTCTRAYRNSGEHPAFPAQWLYGLYVVALVTGFVCHHHCANCSAQLDASIGTSGPHDFTVRHSSVRLRRHRVHRDPALGQTIMTRPSCGPGCARLSH